MARRVRVVLLSVQLLAVVLAGASVLRHVRGGRRVGAAALPDSCVLHDFVHHLLELLAVWRLEVAGGAADRGQLVLLGWVGVVRSVLVRLQEISWGTHTVEARVPVSTSHVKDDWPIVIQVYLLVYLLAEVANLDRLLWIVQRRGLLLHVLRLLEGYARLGQNHLIVLLLDRVVQLNLALLLNLLFLLMQLVHDVGPVLGQAPNKIVVSCEIEAEVKLQILLQADVERRSHPSWPELEV